MKKNTSKFTLSQLEVLRSIYLRKRLPERGIAAGRHRRHNKAIQVLKDQGVIYKDSHDVLQISPEFHFMVSAAIKEQFPTDFL